MGASRARGAAASVALVCALMIPGSSRAGDPWLAFDVRPAEPYLVANGSQHEAVVSLGVHNLTDRTVRVATLEIDYLGDGGRTLARSADASAVFRAAGLASDPSVRASDRAAWNTLCLEAPAGATAARLTFDLATWRGLRKLRAEQVVDVPLRAPTHPPVLALPVRGWWRVTQGHACGSVHRSGYRGAEFAWDLVAIDENGVSFGPEYDKTHRNADARTFGRTIYAPVSGRVVEAVDGIPDNDGLVDFPRRSIVDEVRDPKWVFGNRIVLDAGGGAYVLLGHLQDGSVAVAEGARVEAGQPIARAGNSGNTKDAHLHVQVMNRPDAADPEVLGVPAVFEDYVEITASGTGAAGEAEMRRVAAGDPPEGAVLIAGDARRAP